MTSEIITATPNSPILTRYEPGFRRCFAQGSLIQEAPDDEAHLRLAFWSAKDILTKEDGSSAGTGFRVETEVVLTWEAIERLGKLIEHWQKNRIKILAGDKIDSGE